MKSIMNKNTILNNTYFNYCKSLKTSHPTPILEQSLP